MKNIVIGYQNSLFKGDTLENITHYITSINFDNSYGRINVVIQKGNSVDSINISIQQAQEIGFINLNALSGYCK